MTPAASNTISCGSRWVAANELYTAVAQTGVGNLHRHRDAPIKTTSWLQSNW